MRLYTQFRNSAGERVRIALHLKGIDYDYVSIPALHRGDHPRINPQGLIPALEIDGKVIAQATAILEFLEEIHPSPPLLPADPVERAQVRSFGQLIASDLHPLNNYRIRRYIGTKLGAGEAEILAWYRHWVAVALTALEETLSRRASSAFCFGEKAGWADLHLVPQLSTARRFGCNLAPYPRLLGVEARCAELDAFRRARPEAQPDFDGEIETVVRPV